MFGPLTNLWEGGGQGEKVLQLIKPLWNGFRRKWHHNILVRVLNDMALKRLCMHTCMEGAALDDVVEESKSNISVNGLYTAYVDVAEVKRNFRQRRCMSAVFLTVYRPLALIFDLSGDAGFVICRCDGIAFHPLSIGTVISQKLGLTYFVLTVSEAHLPVLLENNKL